MNLKVKEGINIRDMPMKLMLNLRRHLDSGPESHNWRALAALIRPPFELKQHQIEGFAMQLYSNGSPTDSLVLALGGQGMNVGQLVSYLDQLRVEKILLDLKNYESIKISEQPEEVVKLYEGNCLILRVEATGFPYPRYQWFKGQRRIDGKTENVLKVEDVRSEDEGLYCCRLHNSADNNQVVFTEFSTIKVYPQVVKQRPVQHLEKLPSDEDNTEQDFPEKSNLPVITDHPRDVYIFSGQTFHLNCEAKGRQSLTYTWYRDDNKYFSESKSSVLMVPNAGSHHSGKYTCHVRNDFGEVVSIPAMVTVALDTQPRFSPGPQIAQEPDNLKVDRGGMALFHCKVLRPHTVNYQWFENTFPIPGANSDDLVISAAQGDAIYQCLVTSVEGRVWSRKALLQTRRYTPDLTRTPSLYTATDKVALLVGNYNYRCENILNAPKSDIQTLSEIFRSLNFKVISLLNLTKPEMESALAMFCQLLGKGVYGVFYFCGHGFEENGQCYLIPEDAQTAFTDKECLRAGTVLTQMQAKEPEICCIILDVCRRGNKNGPSKTTSQIGLNPVKGNCVIFYATLVEMAAYETGDSGILVKHMQKHLHKNIKIEDVFSMTREDIGRDDLVIGIQIPEVRTSLLQTTRSFYDQINYCGHTEQFNRHSQAWADAHVIPDPMKIVGCEELGIVLYLEFQSSFSNVLEVYVTVKDKGRTENCIAWIARMPNTVSSTESPFKVSEDKTKNSIQDIQKLKKDLTINLAIRFKRLGGARMEEKYLEKVNLGLPLVAKLRLYQSVQREPVEQTEEEDVANSQQT